MQYTFDGDEHHVLPRPHGNAKSVGVTQGYVRTMPSTMTKLRETAQRLPPKLAVRKLCQDVGDVTGASSASQLPRSRQQAADCRRKLTYGANSSVAPKSVDPLFPLMIMCKESEGKKEKQQHFVRIVANSPEPMAVLAFEWTLEDLERFCTCEAQHTVLCVDPTFDLGSFHVTVMSYRHLMLASRRGSEKGKHPVMLGPLFIHQRKQFSSYHFFFSQLVGLRPGLQNVRAVGTDGEQALANALTTQFKVAIHLRCFLHMRGNLEAKLSELKLPKAVAQEFIWDVFGNPGLLQLGLVDAENSTDLDSQFLQLEGVWNERERRVTSQEPVFHSWFQTYILEALRSGMLKESRSLAGLGDPPSPFYTNDVESKNRVLKYQTNYHKQELPQFVEHMKELYLEQRSEVEKAVAGLGEYYLTSEYQHLGVATKRWFQKTKPQRQWAIARFMNAKLVDSLQSVERGAPSAQDTSGGEERSVPSKDNPLHHTSLPRYTQETMWKKVQRYLDDPSSYTCAPGVSDNSCVLVKSSSGTKPHFVQRNGKAKYKCDGECLMFKSTSGICSHTLLVAVLNDEVSPFVCSYTKSKAGVNYAQLAQHDIPVGGRKPSAKRKGASNKTTAGIRLLMQNADEKEMSKRADIETSGRKAVTGQRSSAQARSTLSSAADALCNPRHGVSMFSSVVWPLSSSSLILSPSTTASPGMTSTPQLAGPPPLIQCAAPVSALASTGAQVNIQAVPFVTPQPFLSPYQSPSMGFPTAASSQLTPAQTQPFWVMFATPRISRCQGCLGQIHPSAAPGDIVLQHKQQVLFQNPNTGTWQLSRDLRNTYYHVSKNCVLSKYPHFNPLQALKVSLDVRQRLHDCHLEAIAAEFGVHV